MSIVRIGLGETKGYHDGYDAIFKKKPAKAIAPAPAKKPSPEKKPSKQAKKK